MLPAGFSAVADEHELVIRAGESQQEFDLQLDESDDFGLFKRALEETVEIALAGVRDYVVASTGASWPGPPDARPPLPHAHAALDERELRIWYGDDAVPAMSLDALTCEDMGFSNRWTGRQDEHRAVALALAAALEERIQKVVPPGFDVSITLSMVGVETRRERESRSSGGPWHFGWGRNVLAEVTASGLAALAGVQEGLVSMLGQPWPSEQTHGLSAADVPLDPWAHGDESWRHMNASPRPRAAVVGEELRVSYGDFDAPVLALEPVRLADIGLDSVELDA